MVKFFDVNNRLCSKCESCVRRCPTNAIGSVNGLMTIDYDKCLACGTCFKVCPESAVVINIPVAEIKNSFSLAKRANELTKKLETLVVENKTMKESLKSAQNTLVSVVEKLPLPIVAVGRDNRINFCNEKFANYAAYAIAKAELAPRTLVGMDVSLVVGDHIASHITTSITHSADVSNVDVSSPFGSKMSLSVYHIRRGEFSLAVFRDLYDTQLLKEEIEERIHAVIDRQMAMIQNIGSLLGEETSHSTKILNSVIKSL